MKHICRAVLILEEECSIPAGRKTADAGDLPAPPPDGTGRGAVLGRRCSAVFCCLSAPFCGGRRRPASRRERPLRYPSSTRSCWTFSIRTRPRWCCAARRCPMPRPPRLSPMRRRAGAAEVWKDQMTNAVSGAELVPGWSAGISGRRPSGSWRQRWGHGKRACNFYLRYRINTEKRGSFLDFSREWTSKFSAATPTAPWQRRSAA